MYIYIYICTHVFIYTYIYIYICIYMFRFGGRAIAKLRMDGCKNGCFNHGFETCPPTNIVPTNIA